MIRFNSIFPLMKRNIIGMIHVGALPATPLSKKTISEIIDEALAEADQYNSAGVQSIMIENMHDIPYIRNNLMGPEIVAYMTAISVEIRKSFPSMPIGIQILSGGNAEALAVASAAGLDYIRTEGFVFGHLGDEGWIQSCAGPLLRQRKILKCEHIAIFTDVKKKHSSHSITSDVDVLQTVEAAKFFLSDGVIITGSSTGYEADVEELKSIRKSIPNIPLIIGSGITPDNIEKFSDAHAYIVGSYFKDGGNWRGKLSSDRIKRLVSKVK